MLVSFSPMKHFFLVVGPPLDVGFEMNLEADVAVWCSDIDPVILEVGEFRRSLMVISTFG